MVDRIDVLTVATRQHRHRNIHSWLTLRIIRSFALFCARTATSTSADSSTFVVTILNGLPRPHGISHTSFIVYLPNLRIKVTVAFWNFTAFCQLVRLIRLGIRFLFVRPRFRYCFFSPKGRPLKLASRYGVRWQLRPVWTFTTDLWHARYTKKISRSRFGWSKMSSDWSNLTNKGRNFFSTFALETLEKSIFNENSGSKYTTKQLLI